MLNLTILLSFVQCGSEQRQSADRGHIWSQTARRRSFSSDGLGLHFSLMVNVPFVEPERAIARHEVREIEQRHIQDGLRESAAAPPDGEDDVVIIYNRVPKTASTSFTNIAYDLCGKNHYHVLHINTTKNNPVMSMQDQVSAARAPQDDHASDLHDHMSLLRFAS